MCHHVDRDPPLRIKGSRPISYGQFATFINQDRKILFTKNLTITKAQDIGNIIINAPNHMEQSSIGH